METTVRNKPPKISRQFLRDRQWVSDHMQELVTQYPNQWILVYNGSVVAHGDQVGPALKKSKEAGWGQPYLRFIERDIHVY